MYDEKYYKKHETGSYISALQILKYITSFIDIKSVIDFGCGMGTWCKAIEDLGISNILGIDQHIYDSKYMLIPEKNYMRYDLRKELLFSHKVDIAISVEVAEHIEEEYSERFIHNLCMCSDLILFSAALPFQGGTGHVNEKSCTFWANIFNKFKYKPIDCIRPHFWNNKQIEVWYRNNCILYAEKKLYQKLLNSITIEQYPLDIVNPAMLERILKKRGLIHD